MELCHLNTKILIHIFINLDAKIRIMKINSVASRVLILVLVFFNIGCDQISKTIVRDNVSYNANIKVITDHITLTKVENSGAFLSVGDSLNDTVKFAVLLLLPALVLLFGIYFLMTKKDLDRLFVLGVCCVIGGGAGNLYDRMLYGSVTDFLHIDFVIFQTGVFNVADMSIMIGMVLILINTFSKKNNIKTAYE